MEKQSAWTVEFRYPKQSKEWLEDITFPALDVIEYDGDLFTKKDKSFDIGKGRAYVHANWLKNRHGSAIETRVMFKKESPFWIEKGEPYDKEIILKCKYDATTTQ